MFLGLAGLIRSSLLHCAKSTSTAITDAISHGPQSYILAGAQSNISKGSLTISGESLFLGSIG